jgi:putative ABC transport system permease protein
MLRKTPGVTAIAVAALALGIGANTAVFTVVNAILIKPLPYPDSGRMVYLSRTYPGSRGASSVSLPKFFAWKRNTTDVLADVAAYDFMGPGVSISGMGEPEQIKAIRASQNYFSLFGVKPAAGRFFAADEDRPGGPKAAVLSYGLWKRRFGGDASIVGRPVSLSGEPHVIVGIAGAGFQPSPPVDVWLPLQADPNSVDQGHYLLCGGRLRPGVTAEAATARMRMAAEQFRRQYPAAMSRDESAGVVSMQEDTVGDVRPILLVMLGAVAFVLLIACANVANILLARAASRDKEIAIRTAIGAGRGRIVKQLLTESMLLAVMGGAVGLVLGNWGMNLLLAATPSELPRLNELTAQSGLDIRVLGFTLLLSLATGVLFGLVPALRISRAGLHSMLKEGAGRGTGGVRHLRTRGLLVVSEVALGLVLLVGAGLLIRSALSMRAVEPGFDTTNVLTFKTALSNEKYSKTAPIAQYMRQLVERVEALPGVSAAASVITVPTEPGPDLTFEIEGRQTAAGTVSGDELWRCASPHFFQALNVPLLQGRTFTDSDAPGAPGVMIVNEAFARKYWPKQNPLGQRITIGKTLGPAFADITREIVGVVGNVRERGVRRDAPPIMYVPVAQVPDALTALGTKILPFYWVVRTSGQPMQLERAIRREALAVDNQQAVFEFRTLDRILATAQATSRFTLLLLSIFAGVALLLAAIGIYGVMSYDVEQRRHEIGIRVALGACGRDVVNLIVRHGMILAAVGIVLGLAGAYGVTRVLAAQLFGIKPTDPATFAIVAFGLAAVALFATWIPARRATRVDPIVALRHQ